MFTAIPAPPVRKETTHPSHRSKFSTRFLLAALMLPLALMSFAPNTNAQTPGTEDPAFAEAHPTGFSEYWLALATQPDGKVLAVGRHGYAVDGLNHKYTIHRFAANGQLDAAFGSNGVVTVDVGTSIEISGTDPFAIFVDPLGRIYAAGTYHDTRREGEGPRIQEYGFALVRLLPNGALDGSFASGGIFKQLLTAKSGTEPAYEPYPETEVERMFASVEVREVVLQPDGKVLLIAEAQEHSRQPLRSLLVARLHTDGSFDTSFASNGLALIPLDEENYDIQDAQVTDDGSLLVLAREDNPVEAGVTKLTAQGTLDTSFGTNGTRHVSDDAAYAYEVYDMALQPDGRILVAGKRSAGGAGEQSDPMVFRLTAGGAFDTSFGVDGFTFPAPTPNSEHAESIALEPGGKIVVAGTTLSGPSSGLSRRPFLLRLAANGDLETVRTDIESVNAGTRDLAVGPSGAFLLTHSTEDTLHKFFIDPVPRSGSLSTGQTPSASGFRIVARDTNGIEVASAQLPHVLGVDGYIFPQSTDLGASADIFIVAESPDGMYLRNSAGWFVPWSGHFSDLVPAYEDVPLTSTVHVPIYAGQLPFVGAYHLYLGYMRSVSGPLIYIEEPVTIDITQ